MRKISDKQIKILAFPYTKYDALICDGAIRSGKTSIMTVAFIDWAMREFKYCNFAICGKTVGSAIKNIVTPYLAMSYAKKRYSMRFNRADNKLTVSKEGAENYFYIYGGKDESSYMLIQGITLAGVLLDEVALMTRSFVEQAIARCSVEGSKFWFNCNPDNPKHWFHEEWIKKAKEKNALHLHFLMNDNPSLSREMLERYEKLYTGVFYQRYIQGLWVIAEGLIYPFFGEEEITDPPTDNLEYYISIDYGTLNPFAALLWGIDHENHIAYVVKEFYYKGRGSQQQLTDSEYYEKVEELAEGYYINSIIIDPSAASFIAEIRKRGMFDVRKANNDVVEGIRRTATYLKSGMIKVSPSCQNTIDEFGLYSWDGKANSDRPIKENDHAMDSMRYFCMTILRPMEW